MTTVTHELAGDFNRSVHELPLFETLKIGVAGVAAFFRHPEAYLAARAISKSPFAGDTPEYDRPFYDATDGTGQDYTTNVREQIQGLRARKTARAALRGAMATT